MFSREIDYKIQNTQTATGTHIHRDIYIQYAQTTADKKRISLTKLQMFGVSCNFDISASYVTRRLKHHSDRLGFVSNKSHLLICYIQ